MKIFLSSTYQDLIVHREAAARAIERLGQQGVRMEVFGARPLEATSACLEGIVDSDALVGIYAHRYGYVPHGQSKSITEKEFDFARMKEKSTFLFCCRRGVPLGTETRRSGARTDAPLGVSPAPSRSGRYRFFYYPRRLGLQGCILAWAVLAVQQNKGRA